jgi:HD-like signal output (HDOD) protein
MSLPKTLHPIPPAAERFFANASKLPAMPEVALRLIKSFENEDVSLHDIAHLIEKDPALSARVLRLANSARYSPAHRIGTLVDAANALGLDSLRNLTMAAAISGNFPACNGLDRLRLWRHAAATAAYARLFAKLLRLDADEVFVAGMMLRTGQLLMAMSEPAAVADVEAHAQEPGSRFSLEQHRFGCTHADVTASLAAHWHFPSEMVQAFTDANEPLAVRPFSPMAAVLHLAEVLADAAEHHDEPVAALRNAVPDLIEHLHLDLDDLRERLAALGDPAQDVELLLH